MGITQSTDGVTTYEKDSDGNIKYSDEPIVLPFVKQDKWANGNNYIPILDGIFAPASGGGYVEKTNFDTTLKDAAPYKSLETGLTGIKTKYNNMQNTYNANFSTIANNLGLTTGADGTVSGTIDSSTFITGETFYSKLNNINSFAGPQKFDDINLSVSKNGNLITVFGNIIFQSGVASKKIDFRKFSIMNNYNIRDIVAVTIQPLDRCDEENGDNVLKIGGVVCKQTNYYTKDLSKYGFTVVRPETFSGSGARWRDVNFIAIYNGGS